VLPAPVTQLPTSSRTSRGDSPAHRTADTSADDHSRSGPTRRDTGTPPSRTFDGSESRQQSSDRTPESGTNPSPAARDTAEVVTQCATPNSFVPGTPVLLADGTYKPIEQVSVGDRVLATDPVTGLTQARPVINLIPGQGLKELVRITVDTDGNQGDATGTWDGSVKATQTFFDPKMSIKDLENAIESMVRQNSATLVRRGARQPTAGEQPPAPIIGTVNGVTYQLGLQKGRVGQFFPLSREGEVINR
jgi:hypothetical protein